MMDKNWKKFIFTIILSFYFCLGIFLLISPFTFAQSISENRKFTTLEYLKKVKQSLGMAEEIEFSERKGGGVDFSPPGSTEKEKNLSATFKENSRNLSKSTPKTGNLVVQYIGTTPKSLFPAPEKGPDVNTILDPYHPKYIGEGIPWFYYKDREGLKIAPFVGVASKYEFKTQDIYGINALEAKQYSNTSASDLKKYTSLSEKRFWETKLSLNIREYFPKFVYTYHDEDIRREYEGKLEWANNRIWGEQNKYHDFKLDYTIPELKYIGFLRIEPGYRRMHRDSDYVADFKADQDRYSLALTCMPWDIGKLKLEYSYTDEDKDEPASLYGASMTGNKIDEVFTELKLHFPRQRLKIIPTYRLKHEEWQLTGGLEETWDTHEAHLKFEKFINDKLEFHSDFEWGYISRDRPSTESPETVKAKGWDVENELYYELFDDFDLILDFGYMDMLDLNNYTAYNIGPRIRYYIPGLIDFGLGYSYVDYYDIGDEESFLFFRFSLFM